MYDYYDHNVRSTTVAERFQERKQLRLPPNNEYHSHGKEYHFSLSWSGDGRKFINYKLDYLNGKLYYLDYGYLFESNEDGTERKIILKVAEFFKTDIAVSVKSSNVFLAVNASGIYLYQHLEQLTVIRFSLTGEFIKRVTIQGDVSQVYIAEQIIYYVMGKRGGKQVACYMELETQITDIIMETSQVLELYGNCQRAVLKVRFKMTHQGRELVDDGWYDYCLESKKLTCISSGNCQPHLLWVNPKRYIEGTADYVEFKDFLPIRGVDLGRNLMWVATTKKERLENGIVVQEYWEPMELAPEGAPVETAPIWRITSAQLTGTIEKQVNEASYFDGSCFLNGRSLYVVKSYDVEGNVEQYGRSKERGACNVFRVLHGHVYADFDGVGWEQYKIEDYQLSFVQACGIGLPESGATSEVKALIRNYRQE